MSNQKDFGFDYSDLSDDDQNRQKPGQPAKAPHEFIPNSQPQKKVKTEDEQKKPSNAIVTPMLFGGRAFIPPPPPPGSSLNPKSSANSNLPPSHYQPPNRRQQQTLKSSYERDQRGPTKNQSSQHSSNVNNRQRNQQRQKKGCVYVKNVPKHFNDADKLMTFFKNEGPIKQIKSFQQSFTAVVRFVKQDHAYKFINSNKPIFNRSYIVYSLNERHDVPANLIKQRQNDQSGKIKRPVELEVKQMKERLDTVFADKYRALLFLIASVSEEAQKQQLKNELQEIKILKTNLPKFTEEECRQHSITITNQYDWTLCFQLNKGKQIQKKHLIFQYQNKYGPVNTIDLKRLNSRFEMDVEAQKPNEVQELPRMAQQAQTFEYIIKLNFLGVRHSWQFYTRNSSSIRPEENSLETQAQQRYMIEVEGTQIKNLFNLGIIEPSIKQKKETPAYQPKKEYRSEQKQSTKAQQDKAQLMNRAAELFNVVEVQSMGPKQPVLLGAQQGQNVSTPSFERNILFENVSRVGETAVGIIGEMAEEGSEQKREKQDEGK